MSDQTANSSGNRSFFYLKNPHKSAVVTVILSLFLGGLGLHRFYLGKPLSGAVMLVLSLVTGFLIVSGLNRMETLDPNGMLIVVSGALGLGMIVSAWALVDLLIILVGVFNTPSIPDEVR
ncbi:NINE protein [Pseudovibrio sp. Alg231-02]|uniref:NINE protein n=1 Tax=Pseudovibrio sp. Alg231-02 TaxID=1922223 RepID=UPI000D5552BC|nr:NINE protein [Pseudovibrio sp. Alg231-02]